MNSYVKTLIIILICLAIMIPLASSSPDGLEMVIENLDVDESKSPTKSLMSNYTIPIVENEYFSTLIAGVAGVFLVLGAALVLGKSMTKSAEQ